MHALTKFVVFAFRIKEGGLRLNGLFPKSCGETAISNMVFWREGTNGIEVA